MLSILDRGTRLRDGWTRRELLRVGGLGALGLSLPTLLNARAPAVAKDQARGRARSCVLLFMTGGPPQHETWDPKSEAPPEIRGEFKPISTSVPGVQFCELMPRLAGMAERWAVLRAVSTNINAHSSSGYWMLTGQEHPRGNVEVAGQVTPSDWPSLGAIVKRLKPATRGLPASITLPEPILNNPNDLWPGQNAGFLGRAWDPWLLRCDPSAESFQIPEISLPPEVPPLRLEERRSLLEQVNVQAQQLDKYGSTSHGRYAQQAFELLYSRQARQAFDLSHESPRTRDRYGRHKFGQSCLLARRLVEAGVPLVQVNWPREPNDTNAGNPVWDTHSKNSERLKTALMPPMDLACSALLDDLDQRGLLDDTLVVWMGEFGRTPKINPAGGRDHWGHVFSMAFAGGGVRGGQVLGSSDRIGAQPRDGRVQPQDLTATIFHALGYPPHTEIHDPLGRPLAISRGSVLEKLF